MTKSVLQGVLRIIALLFGLLLAGAGLYVILHALGAVPGIELEAARGAARGAASQGADIPAASSGQDLSANFHLLFDLAGETLNRRLLWALGGLGALLAGLLFLGLALTPSSESRTRRVVLSGRGEENAYGGGRVTVTQQSLQDMVAHVAGQTDGVREARPRLQLKQGGWHCDCTVSVLPDRALPEIASELKSSLHRALEHHTGLPVERVDVNAQLDAIGARHRLR